MPKPKISEHRYGRILATGRPVWSLGPLLSLGFVLAPALMAQAQEANDVARTTMEQSIELARQKKMRELAASLREKLQPGVSAAPVPPGPAAAPLPPLRQTAPRLWSLTSLGAQVWAEVLLDGHIVALDSGQAWPRLGPWTVQSLTPEALTLVHGVEITRAGRASRDRRVTLVLSPPSRGTSPSTYDFEALGGTGLEQLPDSARQAAQLPFSPFQPSR